MIVNFNYEDDHAHINDKESPDISARVALPYFIGENEGKGENGLSKG